MTWGGFHTLERQAARAVEAMAPEAKHSAGGWRFRLGRQPHAPTVEARVESAWILLDAPLESAALSPLKLAEANGRLPGAVKFALAPEDERIHLRAELPLEVDGDLGGQLLETRRGFELAASLARGGRRPKGSATPGRSDPKGGDALGPVLAGELDRLREEAGWSFSQRASGHLAVDLEVAEGFFQARLGRRADGAIGVSAALEDCHPAAGACREAMAIFLLRSSGWLRMLRGVAASTRKRAAPRFEVIFALEPSASELSEALAALSAGALFCSRELHVLAQNEVLARSYLARNPRRVRSAAERRPRKKAGAVASGTERRAAAASGPRASIRKGRAACPPGTSDQPQQPQGELQ